MPLQDVLRFFLFFCQKVCNQLEVADLVAAHRLLRFLFHLQLKNLEQEAFLPVLNSKIFHYLQDLRLWATIVSADVLQ